MDEQAMSEMPMGEGAPAPDQQMQPQPGQGGVSPQEQAQYDQFVGRAMELIYNKQMFPHLVDMLHGGGDDGQKSEGANGPEKGLAQATVMVVSRVDAAAKEAGQAISPDVKLKGGAEIYSLLAEISDKAGISDYANDRDKLEGTFFTAIDMYLDQQAKAGEIDQAAAQQQMDQLKQMDQNGQLEQLFQDLDARDQAGQGQPQAGMARQEPAPGLKGGMAKGMG
jgi:hypothetical protein